MKLQWEAVLKDVISEVLEKMFFAMVDFDVADLKEEGSREQAFDYESEIDLVNHVGRMEIKLRVSETFARTITANFLGIEEAQVNDEFLEDSLREFANMVGGGYHAHMKSPEWRLGIPTAHKIGLDEKAKACGPEILSFGFFGEPAGTASFSRLPIITN